ncbi:hypothetical protein H1R20_g11587, partial [Candolleomyces eurysporus]
MLQKRPGDLERVCQALQKAQLDSARKFAEAHQETIRSFNFAPGTLVLVQNSRIDSSVGYKTKPRYLGPMVVVHRTRGGSYILSELDGSTSKLCFAAYRLAPYLIRNVARIPVTDLTDLSEDQLDSMSYNREDPIGSTDEL